MIYDNTQRSNKTFAWSAKMALDLYTGIRLFLRVVETKNFSEVAREFRLTPSSVTRSISSLERELGVILLHRSTRKVMPTEAGRTYYPQALKIIRELSELHNDLSGLNSQMKGILRIGAPSTLGGIRLSPLLPAFLKKYPDIRIEAKFTDAYIDILEEGIDVTIRVGIHKDSSLKMKKIENYQRVICASSEYLKKYGVPKRPEDFTKHRCLTFYNNVLSGTHWYFKEQNNIKEIPVKGPLHIDHIDGVIEASVNGLGLCLLPLWLVKSHIKSGKLVEVMHKTPANITTNFDQALYAVYVGQKPSAKVRAFIDYVYEKFNS